jgi:hypothetical protein
MRLFLIAVLFIATATCFLPVVVRAAARLFPAVKLHDSHDWLPSVAAMAFIASLYLPVISISEGTSTFQQHFVGGGVYCALLYVYFRQLLGWKLSLASSIVVLFAWVSAFGVANELAELAVTQLGIARIDISDTDWDLLANTTGAIIGYLILVGLGVEKSSKK